MKEKMIKAKAEKGIPVTPSSLRNTDNVSLLEKKLSHEIGRSKSFKIFLLAKYFFYIHAPC